MEEAGIERFEDFVEVVVMADGGKNAFATSRLANVFGLFRDSFRTDVTPIAVSMHGSNRLFVELGQQDMGDGAMDRFRSGLQKVGESNMEPAFAKANRGVERRKTTKTDVKGGNGSARTKVSILLFKNRNEC